MLGRKTSRALAERVRKISETPPPRATGPADPLASKRAVRKPSFRPGTLTFMNGDRLDCVVTNVSGMGAEVRFVRASHLPERVLLSEPMSGMRKWAYVSWQTWGVAGLQFVGAKAGR
jgi:hypothetical protein